MSGDVIAILFSILIFLMPSIFSKIGKALKSAVAMPEMERTPGSQPTEELDEEYDEDWTMEEDDSEEDALGNKVFSYEEPARATTPDNNLLQEAIRMAQEAYASNQKKQKEERPCREAVEEPKRMELDFDLRQAIIYDTILNNNYIHGMK